VRPLAQSPSPRASKVGNDPEPEYVAINDKSIAVVTLQDNNHIVLVDLKNGKLVNHFPAGSVNLTQIDTVDERPNLIDLKNTQEQQATRARCDSLDL